MFTYCSVAALVLELAGTDAMAQTHMVFATFPGKTACLPPPLRLQHGHMGEALPIKNGKSNNLAVL